MENGTGTYCEFRDLVYTGSADADRTKQYRFHFALDAVALENLRARTGDSEPMPKDEKLVGLLLECGAVLHDKIIDGLRQAAVQVIENPITSSIKLKEVFYQHGLLDDPAPGKSAWTIYDSKGRMNVRSFWKTGLLNDPVPGVPAIIKFASVWETFFDHKKSFGINSFSEPTEDSMAEKYRAYFLLGVMRDTNQEPAEQWRNPYDGQIYCAHSATGNKYLTSDELKALNEMLKTSAPTMVAENPASPRSLPQNKPKPPFSFRI